MKILQFNLENFNPDGMSVDELHQWAAFIGNGVRPQIAKQWFPGAKGQYRHAKNIRAYIWNAITARGCRERGEIQAALMYEAICDRVYSDLPPQAKW